MEIEGQILTSRDKGFKVKQVPTHAKGDTDHEDCELGIISSWNEHVIFVNYGKGTNQATSSENLIWR